MKKPVVLGDGLFHIYLHYVNYKSKNQDNNCEIPKSTPVKNKPIITTVEITTIVYFVNSLPFGQLVFLISAPTSRRNVVILLILTYLRTNRIIYLFHYL